MQIIVWAGLFLLLSVVGSTITLAGMVGMPIASGVQAGLMATAVLVVGSGIVLSAAARRTTQQRMASR